MFRPMRGFLLIWIELNTRAFGSASVGPTDLLEVIAELR